MALIILERSSIVECILDRPWYTKRMEKDMAMRKKSEGQKLTPEVADTELLRLLFTLNEQLARDYSNYSLRQPSFYRPIRTVTTYGAYDSPI